MKLKIKVLFFVLCVLIGFNLNALRLTMLSDVHVTPGNENEPKLVEAVAEINKSDCDLVVLSGDLSNEGSDAELNNIKAILDKIEKPFYIIPGNHENNWSQSACKTFNDLWGADRFVTVVDDVVIIGLNCGPFMKMGDGHIKQEDLTWLDETLAQYKDKQVISINHYPIMPDIDNYVDYVKILEKYNTVVHLCGHYHRFRHYKGGDIDALMCRALHMGKDDFGYTIIDMVNDSIKQYNKRLNEEPELLVSFKINHNLKPIEVENDDNAAKPRGYEIERIHKDEASIFTRVGYDKGNIYFGNSLGLVKSISKSGKVNWTLKTDASLFSRPAVADKYVIVPTADKRLMWVDKATGKIVYQMYSQGPYVADGVIKNGILYQGGYKMFEAWNVNDMRPIWRCATNNYCQAAPVVTDKEVIFGAWDTYLRNVDVKTGRENWKWNNGRKANMLGPGNCVPVVTNDKVIIVAPDRYMTALDRTTGKEIWRDNMNGDHNSKVRESLGCSKDGKDRKSVV